MFMLGDLMRVGSFWNQNPEKIMQVMPMQRGTWEEVAREHIDGASLKDGQERGEAEQDPDPCKCLPENLGCTEAPGDSSEVVEDCVGYSSL